MIRSATDPRWVQVALEHLDRVLVDHAHCEKKAAANALALVASYPDRVELVERVSLLAIEELRHFRAVHDHLRSRGLTLGKDLGDPYAKSLRSLMRTGPEPRFVDRLLVAGLIEARSCERLGLLAGAIEEPGLAAFYAELTRAEAVHADLFVELAAAYADRAHVHARLEELAKREAEIVAELPVEPRIH